MTVRSFTQAERLFSLRLDQNRRRLVERYWESLKAWNRNINLTAVTSWQEAVQFHFFEAFWLADRFLTGPQGRLADIGSGAGFPGLAIKLYRPDLEVVLIEKSHKKAVFLDHVSRQLGLKVEIYQGTAETYPDYSRISLATARALKPSQRLIGLLRAQGIPLLLLHGNLAVPLTALKAAARSALPGSRNRFASLFALDASVPRETTPAIGR